MEYTKLFLDTEFTGLHQNTTLISLALVAETGDEFYAEFNDYDESQIDSWIQENVLDHLLLADQSKYSAAYVGKRRSVRGTVDTIAEHLIDWLAKFERVEIWSDTLAYDWVLFCQLFGGALEIPKHIYYIPFDLATSFRIFGIDPDANREEFAAMNGWKDDLPKHNALHDARVQQACYQVLYHATKDLQVDL